nr:iron-containing alcohol dehydrogenase [Clostridioides mangenotii]
MLNFEYFTPTKVVFGRDAEFQVGKLIKEGNYQKVLVHFGGISAKKSGLLDRVYKSLDEAGITYISVGGLCQIQDYLKYMKELKSAKKKKWILYWLLEEEVL